MIVQSLKYHMLIAQGAATEEELSFARRTGLTVWRIQNRLVIDKKGLILKDALQKQGDKINKNTETRICTLTAKELQWFHNDAELQSKRPLGSINLEFIYGVFKSFQVHNDRPTFMLSVTMWADKNGIEHGKRDFFFSCDDEISRDKWIIAIEYLKTKAIYDAYANQNSHIGFNMLIDFI